MKGLQNIVDNFLSLKVSKCSPKLNVEQKSSQIKWFAAHCKQHDEYGTKLCCVMQDIYHGLMIKKAYKTMRSMTELDPLRKNGVA